MSAALAPHILAPAPHPKRRPGRPPVATDPIAIDRDNQWYLRVLGGSSVSAIAAADEVDRKTVAAGIARARARFDQLGIDLLKRPPAVG